MPVRQTSIVCYHRIKDEGLLSKRRFEVYESLVESTQEGEKVSAAELFYRMKRMRNPSHSNVATRLGELRDMGVASEVGNKVCSITKRTVIAWIARDALPKSLERKQKHRRVVRVDADQMAEDLFEAIFMGPMNQMKDRLDNVFRKHFKIPISSFFNKKSQSSQKRPEPGQISFDL